MGATDRELMARMARGDQKALASLYEEHADAIYRTISALLRDDALAADTVQDVFMEAWRKADTYDPARGSVRAWLVVRARSRALDRIRSRTRKGEVSLTDTGRGRMGTVQPSLDKMHLAEAFRVVSDEEREVLLLGYFEGLTCVEIGERLNVPVGTVKSRTRTAVKKMRGFWETTQK